MSKPNPRKGGCDTFRKILKYAEDNGWTVSKTKNDHVCFRKPGCRAVFGASTPGCHSNFQLMKTKFKRAEREGLTQ